MDPFIPITILGFGLIYFLSNMFGWTDWSKTGSDFDRLDTNPQNISQLADSAIPLIEEMLETESVWKIDRVLHATRKFDTFAETRLMAKLKDTDCLKEETLRRSECHMSDGNSQFCVCHIIFLSNKKDPELIYAIEAACGRVEDYEHGDWEWPTFSTAKTFGKIVRVGKSTSEDFKVFYRRFWL